MANSRRDFLEKGTIAAGVVALNSLTATAAKASGFAKGKTAKRFSNKTVLITGATSGIGKAAAEAFAHEGAKVFFCGRRENLGLEVQNQIQKSGGEATFFKADVESAKDMEAFINACVKKYGSVDIAFNNAGRGFHLKKLIDIDESEWDGTFNTNAKGVFLSMKEEIKQMLKQKQGVILNMASVAGHRASKETSVYSASKYAIVGLTRNAAIEYGSNNIRINSISPGIIKDAEQGPADIFQKNPDYIPYVISQGRLGTIADVVGAVLWICSEEASLMIGTDFAIDGGLVWG